MVTYQRMEETDLQKLYDFAAPIWKECYRDVLPLGRLICLRINISISKTPGNLRRRV